MNALIYKSLKVLRKVNSKLTSKESLNGRNWKIFSNKEYANTVIYDLLIQEDPCMIARFGSTEMLALVNYLGVQENNKSFGDFISGKSLPWWWEKSTLNQMQKWSGFFPPKEEYLEKFCEMMIDDIEQVDILGSWLNQEKYFNDKLINTKKLVLEDLEPFFSTAPWTRALEGKKVLVVHPFAETIESQYLKRELIFEKNLLPDFDLKTIQAVQSVAGTETQYKDWFEALESMKRKIEQTDFDICIIGCGAYGFPLAAHVKKMGKKSIHLAGATQLLFGIKGKRWEDFIVWPYTNLFNKHWVRPGEQEKPKNANIVEGACYW